MDEVNPSHLKGKANSCAVDSDLVWYAIIGFVENHKAVHAGWTSLRSEPTS
jgi:hypothetical protein